MSMGKRKRSNELEGRTVMVHPDLTTDPAWMTGMVAKIVDDNGECLLLEFEHDIKARYSYDAVIALIPCKGMLDYLLDNFESLSTTAKKVMLQVAKLEVEGQDRQAFALLRLCPEVLPHCTQSCMEIREQYNKARRNRPRHRL